jgi:hypothetical protein
MVASGWILRQFFAGKYAIDFYATGVIQSNDIFANTDIVDDACTYMDVFGRRTENGFRPFAGFGRYCISVKVCRMRNRRRKELKGQRDDIDIDYRLRTVSQRQLGLQVRGRPAFGSGRKA